MARGARTGAVARKLRIVEETAALKNDGWSGIERARRHLLRDSVRARVDHRYGVREPVQNVKRILLGIDGQTARSPFRSRIDCGSGGLRIDLDYREDLARGAHFGHAIGSEGRDPQPLSA